MTPDNPTALRVLNAAHRSWNQLATLRSRRDRFKRFTYGDQWADTSADADGNIASERDHALRRGHRPLTNNMIRRLVRCVVGRWREDFEKSPEDPSNSCADVYADNHLGELDARLLEEFLISGCAIQRVDFTRQATRTSVDVVNVNPNRFIINAINEPRARDTEIVGMLHDMSVTEVVMRFAHGDARRALELRRHYAEAESMQSTPTFCAVKDADNQAFFRAPSGRCRVIEIWTLEASSQLRCHDPLTATMSLRSLDSLDAIERENLRRSKSRLPLINHNLEMSTVWHCRWLSPAGAILDEYDSPYPHGCHPFVVKFYPLTDGEVHSLVEDVIDQQIYINRLITLIDHVIGSSAKGVLLFPQQQLIDGFDLSAVGRMWAQPDGVIPYAGTPGIPEPHQLVTNTNNLGARELLAIQLKMFEDVSGVTGALMGKSTGGGNVGVERFESEVRNATININDLLRTFANFCSIRDSRIAALL